MAIKTNKIYNNSNNYIDLDKEISENNKWKYAESCSKIDGKTLEEIKKEIIDDIQASGDIQEFMLIENGKKIRYSTDSIDKKALDNGFELFCPHSREEYELARRYLLSIGKPRSMGPLGIYNPNGGKGYWCSRCWHSNIPLNSEGLGKHGWKVKDGSDIWWASDRTNVTEPNGDYYANAYLGISYDNNGYVSWYNDANANYSYTTYLCVKRKK